MLSGTYAHDGHPPLLPLAPGRCYPEAGPLQIDPAVGHRGARAAPARQSLLVHHAEGHAVRAECADNLQARSRSIFSSLACQQPGCVFAHWGFLQDKSHPSLISCADSKEISIVAHGASRGQAGSELLQLH